MTEQEVFLERFGKCPDLESRGYTTHLGLYDIEFSGVVDGKTYTWSSAYGWYDEV